MSTKREEMRSFAFSPVDRHGERNYNDATVKPRRISGLGQSFVYFTHNEQMGERKCGRSAG